ncbi:MAG: hypothetical protein KJ838_01835 [Candidatus Omnitrophica bacterium]|nr:hypothetical protein [Candidatus Omnitrophota bacterium]
MKIIYSIFISLLLATTLAAQEWQELKSEHFMLYFLSDENKEFSRGVLNKAEKDYNRIASDLGYSRNSNFWTWDNRVKIFVYPDHETYLKESGQPEWSEGMANYKNKSILSYSGSSNFLVSVLPHEMTHLIFRDFIGIRRKVPLWLDEGIAQWEEEAKRQIIKKTSKACFSRGTLFSIKDLMELDIHLIDKSNKIHLRGTSLGGEGGFLIIDGKSLVDIYYIESASLVGFLIERHGTENFTEFCRQLRDGRDLEGALSAAYPAQIHNIQELEAQWIEYLKEE